MPTHELPGKDDLPADYAETVAAERAEDEKWWSWWWQQQQWWWEEEQCRRTE